MIAPFPRHFAIRCVVAALALLSPGPLHAAQTAGPVTDPLGVIRIPAAAPLQVGAYWVISGPDTSLGLDSERGVEIAIAEIRGSLLGHKIKLNVEDDGCSAEGGQTAATKLAANPQTVIVLGGACSSAVTPAAPILWRAGIVNICTGCTAPSLTAPDRKPGYDGLARTIGSDLDQAAADARYLHDVVKGRRLVTIHDGSPYAQQLTSLTAGHFRELGGEVPLQEAISPTDVDMHPLLARIASAQPDVLFFPVFVAAGAQLLRQTKEAPGLEKAVLVGGSSLGAAAFMAAAGPAVVGFRICTADVSPDTMGRRYPDFVARYKTMFGEAPISDGNATSYDAAMMAFMAIRQVARSDANGDLLIGRKALRDAVFAVTFDGMSGRIACDAHGQCAAFKPAVYQYISADPDSFALGRNPKKVWP
jgi:branched-chain amino acid transport system substrate-binding protein